MLKKLQNFEEITKNCWPALGAVIVWDIQWPHRAWKPYLSAQKAQHTEIKKVSLLKRWKTPQLHLVWVGNKILQCPHLLIYSAPPPLRRNNQSSIQKLVFNNQKERLRVTFSDMLWTSAALLRFEPELLSGTSFTGSSSTSNPSFNPQEK